MRILTIDSEFAAYYCVVLDVQNRYTCAVARVNRYMMTDDGCVPKITEMLDLIEYHEKLGNVSLVGWYNVSNKDYYKNKK